MTIPSSRVVATSGFRKGCRPLRLALVGQAVEGAGKHSRRGHAGGWQARPWWYAAGGGRARIAARIGRAAAGRGEQFRDVGSTNRAVARPRAKSPPAWVAPTR
jgi:hypothetical protein